MDAVSPLIDGLCPHQIAWVVTHVATVVLAADGWLPDDERARRVVDTALYRLHTHVDVHKTVLEMRTLLREAGYPDLARAYMVTQKAYSMRRQSVQHTLRYYAARSDVNQILQAALDKEWHRPGGLAMRLAHRMPYDAVMDAIVETIRSEARDVRNDTLLAVLNRYLALYELRGTKAPASEYVEVNRATYGFDGYSLFRGEHGHLLAAAQVSVTPECSQVYRVTSAINYLIRDYGHNPIASAREQLTRSLTARIPCPTVAELLGR